MSQLERLVRVLSNVQLPTATVALIKPDRWLPIAASLVLAACSPNFPIQVELPGGLPFLSAPDKAGLQVLTGEVAASVFLDDQFVEKSPFITQDIQPGSYRLSINPDDAGLVPYQTQLRLRPGLLTVVSWTPGRNSETSGGVVYELEPLDKRSAAELSVVTVPDRAIVSVDGGQPLFAPMVISDVSPGEHTLSVSLPSYLGQEYDINLPTGHRLVATVKLAREGAALGPSSQPSPQPQPGAAVPSVATGGASTVQPAPPEVVATASAASAPRLTVLKSNYFQNGQEVIRVRAIADAGGGTIGLALVGQSYPFLGPVVDNWYQILFEDSIGWVSGRYVKLGPTESSPSPESQN
ncbi:MAG: hypothetical protein COU69_01155 [Candidatus Pacebacteria bacterium CG10_big_fil_rev_8_21_14_0_10_56_10]|nr:MAG: hypothetical protein COU69_01155 [Candidatus Pacebacteria bacterium CG10_big_fil_rev_8_21_14_0_10_56_10]